MKEENVTTPDDLGTYSYDDIIGTKFKLVNSSEYYEYDSQYQVWKDKTDNEDYMKSLVANGEDLTVVGIVKPAEDAKASSLSPGIAYPHIIDETCGRIMAAKSEIVKQQLANPDVNVFTNKKFGEKDSENGFSMDSLFTVDEAALQKAFGFDASAMNNLGNSLDFGNSLNLSESMDLSKAFQTGSNTLDLSGLVNPDSLNLDLFRNAADESGRDRFKSGSEGITGWYETDGLWTADGISGVCKDTSRGRLFRSWRGFYSIS